MTRISVEELLNESVSDTEERAVATRTLVFVTVSDNCKYSRQWSVNSETAKKLTLKEFMRYMVRKDYFFLNSFHLILPSYHNRRANALGLPTLFLRIPEFSTLMRKMMISLSGVMMSTRRWSKWRSTKIR